MTMKRLLIIAFIGGLLMSIGMIIRGEPWLDVLAFFILGGAAVVGNVVILMMYRNYYF